MITRKPSRDILVSSKRFVAALATICIGISLSGCSTIGGVSGPNPRNSFDIRDYNVRDYGAVGDGKTLDTKAFARAIAACTNAGGGTVRVGAGRYLSGTIELKSFVTLDLAASATIVASQSPADFSPVDEVWHDNLKTYGPLIYATDADHVAITGTGTLDGRGQPWWAAIIAEKGRRKKIAATNPDAPEAKPTNDTESEPLGRPKLIRFVRCKDAVIEHISLHDSPHWNIHALLCERVRVDGVTIVAPADSPNTDGVNIESCRDVQIVNCRVDNGDDSITLKSGMNEVGRKMNRPCEDITITNCVIYHGHGGVSIGSEMSGGVRNVVISNCVFHGTDNGLRIKSTRGRGGVVEGISASNIVMQDVNHPFTINEYYTSKDRTEDEQPFNEGTPTFRNFLFSNISARGAKDAGAINGLSESPIANVTFDNVHVQAATGFTCKRAKRVTFLDTVFDVERGQALTITDCSDIRDATLEPRGKGPATIQAANEASKPTTSP